MRNVWLITSNTMRELLSKKSVYLLFLLILFILIGNGFDLVSIIYSGDSAGTEELLNRQRSLVTNMLGPWAALTTLFAVIFAAGSVYSERKSKTIVGVLAKPLSRNEFLGGKILGVQIFFGSFLLLGVLLVSILIRVWGLGFTGLYWTGIAEYFATLLVFSGMSFVLSLFITPYAGGGVTFLLWTFRGMFENVAESTNWVVSGFGYFFYFVTPALNGDPLIDWGVNNNAIHSEMLLYWGVIAENLLYFGIFLYLGMLFYRRKDIVVG